MHIVERDTALVVTVIDQCGQIWRDLEPLLGGAPRGVVLDLAQVGFLNSVNIAAIIAVRNKVVGTGGRFAVANLPEPVKAVFRILRLERLFDLDLGIDQAVARVKPGG